MGVERGSPLENALLDFDTANPLGDLFLQAITRGAFIQGWEAAQKTFAQRLMLLIDAAVDNPRQPC